MKSPDTNGQKHTARTSLEPPRVWRKLLMVLRLRSDPAGVVPQGQRSGAGAGSVMPYLEQERGTRPADLE